MGRPFLIAAGLAALLTVPLLGQQSSQAVPDAPQPQPQKKSAPKPDPKSDGKPESKNDQQPAANGNDSKPADGSKPADASKPADGSQPADSGPATKDDNAFPEDVSKAAAAKASGDSNAGSQQTPPATGQHSTSDDNAFPEAQSKAAAKAAGNDTEATPAAKATPGVSSSSSSSILENLDSQPVKIEPDPGRSKKDTQVGGFYLQTGNYQGALDRFQDAMTYDATNVDAIFGLAETQRYLKKNSDAVRNYQLYLDILPNGPKSKQALKALKTLGSGG
jgi:tetratricopeptide (TPR) repeat protein